MSHCGPLVGPVAGMGEEGETDPVICERRKAFADPILRVMVPQNHVGEEEGDQAEEGHPSDDLACRSVSNHTSPAPVVEQKRLGDHAPSLEYQKPLWASAYSGSCP